MLADLFPRPRRLRLAGGAYRAAPLTLGQLADLERWFRARTPHRRPAVPRERRDREFPAAVRHAAACYLAARDWPPAWGSARAESLLGSAGGAAEFLFVLLRPHNRGFRRTEARALAGALSPREWARVSRIAYGDDPAARAVAALAAATEGPPERPEGKALGWAGAAAKLIARGLAPRDVAGLTLAAARLVLADGERPTPKLRPLPGQGLRQAAAARARLLAEARKDVEDADPIDVARREGPPGRAGPGDEATDGGGERGTGDGAGPGPG